MTVIEQARSWRSRGAIHLGLGDILFFVAICQLSTMQVTWAVTVSKFGHVMPLDILAADPVGLLFAKCVVALAIPIFLVTFARVRGWSDPALFGPALLLLLFFPGSPARLPAEAAATISILATAASGIWVWDKQIGERSRGSDDILDEKR